MAKKFDFKGLKGKVIHKLGIRGKLLRKVVLLVALLSVIPLLVSGFLFLYVSENLTERNAKKLQLEVVQRAAVEIDDYIANVEGKISVATKTKGFLAGDETRQKWMLEVLFKEIPALSQIVLVDTIGKEKIKLSRYHHFTSKELGDVSSKKAFAAALGGRNYSGKVYIVEAEPYFELAIPVVSEKKVIGVVLAELNLKYFWDLLSDFKVGEKGITYLIDEEGIIIAHPDLSLVFKGTKTSYPHFQTEGSEAGIFVPYEDVSGIRVVGSCVVIEGLGWYVVAEQPLSEVYHELNMMKLNISLLLFATALVAIFFGVLYSKKIVEPIKLLQSGVSKVSGGDFTPRLEIKTGDELEDLAKDFNLMAKNLKQSYEDLQTYEGRLEQAVKEKTKELSITTDELKQKTDEMSVLLDILKTVASTLELEELLPVVLSKVVSLFGMQAGGVFLIDETSLTRCAEVHKCKMTKCAAFKSESLKCWAIPHTLCRKEISGKFKEKMERCKECPVFKSINLRLEAVVGASIPTGITVNIAESLCEKALYELKKPTIFSYDELIGQKTKRIFSDYMKVESQILLPLVEWTHEDVSGIITLVSSRERFYTSAEINLLSNVADYLALAIYRVKLFEKTKRSAVESRSLYEISKILGSTLNLETLLNLAVNFAMGVLHGDVASVMLLDEEKQELTIKASIGLSESVISKARVKVGEGIAGWVARAGEPLWISDVSQDKRFKHLKPREKLMAAVCVPLKVKEKILGVLSVGSYYPQRFLESDLRMVSTLAGQAAVAVNNAQLFYQFEELYFTTIKAFVRAIEAKDPYTRGHSERVTLNAVAIAKEMNLSDEEVEVIETAGLLHDIGKMGVKEEILNKPSILTKEEYDLVKLHPLIASKIMEGIPRLGKVVPLIAHHHERYDGNGYIDGLKGEDIPLGARILAVADAFDAMTSARPYRKARSLSEAIKELKRNTGTQFDPKIVEAFLRLLEKEESKEFVLGEAGSAGEHKFKSIDD